MIVGRPLRAMFVHKVRELDVLRLLSVRVEVVTDLVHVTGLRVHDRYATTLSNVCSQSS